MPIYRFEELLPDELEARLRECPLLVMPFGTLEWHSYHLPLGLDGIVAAGIGSSIAERLGAVLAPVSYWAVGGVPYPYTLDLPIEQVEPLLGTLFEQFGAMGFRVIVGFTGHFGLAHTLAFKRAAMNVMRRSPVTILPATEYDLVTDAGYLGDHAAQGETSLLWGLRPDLVHLDRVASDATLDGILGKDPRSGDRLETGQALAELIAARTAEVTLRLWQATSSEERASYLRAVEAGVRVLAETQRRREMLPKPAVPSLNTPAFLEYCQAMYRGDYRAAAASAGLKLADLTR